MNHLKKILKISLPNVIGLGSKFLCDLINIFWIAQISTEAVAGVVTVTMITWIMVVFDDIFKAGAVSIISRSFGAKNYSKVKSYIYQLIIWKTLLIFGLVILVIIFLKPILSLFVNSDTLIPAYSYGFIRIATLPFQFILFSSISCLNCLGKGGLAMYPPFIANILNLVLDPIFIFKQFYGFNFGFGLNESGAALATAISFFVAATIGTLILYKHLKLFDGEVDETRWSTKKIMDMLSVGYPVGIRNITRHATNLFLIKIVGLYGTIHVAAYGTVGRIMGVYYVPILAFLIGGTASIGHEIGKNNDSSSVSHISKIVFWCMLIIMGGLLLFNIVCGLKIIQLFDQHQSGIESSYKLLIYGMLGLLFIAMSTHKVAEISASKNLNKLLYAALISRLFVQIPLVLLFSLVLKFPIDYIWLTFPIADFAEMIYLIVSPGSKKT